MRIYRSLLVWILRLIALAQMALGTLVLFAAINWGGGDRISEPLGVAQRDPVEQAVATLLGPLVCLAIAEVLALLNVRQAGQNT